MYPEGEKSHWTKFLLTMHVSHLLFQINTHSLYSLLIMGWKIEKLDKAIVHILYVALLYTDEFYMKTDWNILFHIHQIIHM